MKRISLLITAIFISGLLEIIVLQNAESAGGQCSVREHVQLAQAGYTKADIEDLCRSADRIPSSSSRWGILAGEGQPRWVQWCATPQGRCSLNPVTSGYYPIGAPCNCYMPWGVYGGVAQ